MNNLVLVTNHFPYGTGEAFIETEIKYLTNSFDRVVVVARNVKSAGIRNNDGSFAHHRINPVSNAGEKILLPWLVIRNFTKTWQYLRNEKRSMKKRNLYNKKNRRTMIKDLLKALITAHHLEKLIKKEKLCGRLVLYAYWMNSTALALTFVKSKNVQIKTLCRGHRGDIYEYASQSGYLSFRTTICNNLHAVFSISADGQRHLSQFVDPSYINKIKISRLGTLKIRSETLKKQNRLVLASCSNISAVKRVHYIVEALSLINDLDIDWIHIGTGVDHEKVEAVANEKLSIKPNITYVFKGHMSNTDILDFYATHYIDLFVNTSSSEGIPVSIMEVLSFGIPVIAFDVGGIPEIVNNSCGRLLPQTGGPADVAAALKNILNCTDEQRNAYRESAFSMWRENYNAETNYTQFAAQLLSL